MYLISMLWTWQLSRDFCPGLQGRWGIKQEGRKKEEQDGEGERLEWKEGVANQMRMVTIRMVRVEGWSRRAWRHEEHAEHRGLLVSNCWHRAR